MDAMTATQVAALLKCPTNRKFTGPEGTRRDTLRNLAKRGYLRMISSETKRYTKYITRCFGRIPHAKSYAYIETWYEMTDAGRKVLSEQVTAN